MNKLNIANYSHIFKYGYWEGQEKFSDGTLYTDDGTQFPIHRVILSRSSQYFRGLFSFDSSRKIKISEIDGKILEQILVFIYTGQAALTQENVWALMIAADYMLMDDLLLECRRFALRTLTVGNCMSAITTAFMIEKMCLFQGCLRFVTFHFEGIVRDPMTDLELLPFKIFSILLRSDSLHVSTERTVWMAITRWVTGDTENRLSNVPQLLTNLRLNYQEFDPEMASWIVAHDIVRNNPFGLSNIISGMNMVSEPRLPRHLYFVARHFISDENNFKSELFLTVDERLDWFRRLGEVPFFAEVALVLGHTLHLFNTSGNTSTAYDLVEGTWKQMSQLSMKRYNYSVVALRGCFYATGGYLSSNLGALSARRTADMIKCYRPKVDPFWHSMHPQEEMIIRGAVVFGDKIIIIGHTFTNEAPAMICQVYDANSKLWTTVSPPAVFRRGFSAVVFGSSVIVAGGEKDGLTYLTSVEQYNPETDTWDSLPDLPSAYFTPKAVVVEDKLLVFDNYHENSRYGTISPPVIWNADNKEWEVIDKSSPFHGIERHTFCKIEDRDLVKILTLKSRSLNVVGYRV